MFVIMYAFILLLHTFKGFKSAQEQRDNWLHLNDWIIVDWAINFTSTNSEDPDEMLHDGAFHLGLQC